MIKAKDLTYSHAGKKLCLERASFEIFPGQIVGVLGENGEGKSTLLKLMVGIYPATEGSICINGKSPFSYPEVLENIYYVELQSLFFSGVKVKDFFDYIKTLYSGYSIEDEKRLVKALHIDVNKNFNELSTGYQKRVEVIAAMASRAKIIILDEVFAVLDPKARKFITAELKNHCSKHQIGIVLATNISDDVVSVANRILYLENKKIKELSFAEYERVTTVRESK